MNRLVAGAALVVAVLPLGSASALPPPRHRAIDCTKAHVLRETDVQRYLLCLNQREASAAGKPTECFVQYVTRAEPVPRTPEEYVAAAVRDVNRTVTFAGCVVAG